MTKSAALLEDTTEIRMALQRLCLGGARLEVAFKAQRGAYPILTEDGEKLAFRMPFEDIGDWGLKAGDNLALKLKDRGLEYECVVAHAGQEVLEGVEASLATIPRVLRRSDMHRLADFIPERPPTQAHAATFTNTRNALIDGTVQSFGEEGLELVLRNSKQDIRELLRMGEESLLDVPLGNDLRLRAPTTVAYFGDNLVGLRFTKQADAKVLADYRTWIQDQQLIQAQEDREGFSPRGFQEATARANHWDLWGAAYLIHGVVSDDMFWDVRAGLVALGQEAFEAALADADSLASVKDVVERTLFEDSGGFPEIDLMEDVAISRNLRKSGPPLSLSATLVTSSRRWEKNGIWCTIVLMWRLRLAYFLGSEPRHLAELYHGRKK